MFSLSSTQSVQHCFIISVQRCCAAYAYGNAYTLPRASYSHGGMAQVADATWRKDVGFATGHGRATDSCPKGYYTEGTRACWLPVRNSGSANVVSPGLRMAPVHERGSLVGSRVGAVRVAEFLSRC